MALVPVFAGDFDQLICFLISFWGFMLSQGDRRGLVHFWLSFRGRRRFSVQPTLDLLALNLIVSQHHVQKALKGPLSVSASKLMLA